jgi:hypothetical protein
MYILLLVLHLICIHLTILFLALSQNIYLIGSLLLITIAIFVQCLVYDGCVLTTLEGPLPGTNMTMTEAARYILGITEPIKQGSLEKIFVGVTLYFLLIKFIALYFGIGFDMSRFDEKIALLRIK